MAQLDTGLGWSAKSEYLTSLDNVQIGYISSIGGPGLTTPPGCLTAADVCNMGVRFARASYGVSDYAAPYDEFPVTFAYVAEGSVYRGYAITTTNEYGTVAMASTDGGSPFGFSRQTATNYDSTTGLYYFRYGVTVDPEYATPGMTPFSTLRDALDAVVITQRAFYKLNSGFAVACVAEWYTTEGTDLIAPVLISTVSLNTVISTDGSTPSADMTTFDFLLDGARFYMTIIGGNTETITPTTTFADLRQFAAAAPSKVFRILASETFANILVTETVDPYEDFGYTEEDAGEINPDPQDDEIDFDDLPEKSFATAGFCRIFNPDVSDLNDLASYMWTDQNFLQTVINHLKQILENPIEAIISLSMVPVQPQVGSSKVPVNVMFINTGVSMRPVTSQFVTVDCGTTVLQECYGGALDYNPYTRVQIYLPYIGIVQLDTDEVMAKTLHLKYHIDVVTGICCAEIKADNKLLYSFSGHCAVSQPITSADFSSYLNAAVAAAKVAVGVGTGMASTTAGAAASELPPAVPSRPQTSSALVPIQSSGAIGPHLGSPGLSGSRGWTDFSDIPEPQSNGGTAWGELAKPGNVNTVASAMGGKMVVQHSGGFSGNSGYLAKRRPYLIVIRPRIANPRNYAQHFGRTSMEYLNLGSCTGYTKVQSVHLSGFDATNPELSEISSLLKGGVLM